MVVRIVVAVYVGLCLLLFFAQSKYLYYPGRDIGQTPADAGMKFDDVVIRTEDGESIAAWYVPAASNAGSAVTLLDCHGNAGSIGDRVESVRTFHGMGLNVLIFDYRGYGKSTGRTTEEGTYKDAMAAWKYLVEQRGASTNRIVLFGRSLGGAVASWLAVQVRPRVLVIESSFSSVRDMAARIYPYLPVRLLCRFNYDNVDNVGKVRCAVLVAHSTEDDMIPYEHGRRIFAAANEPKLFVEMRGGHNAGGLDIHPDYQAALLRFIEQHAGPVAGKADAGEVR
ncbi:MAG: alpha/beta hydrolase [Verrucomicrobia bacterium]|nr:alpha/beta hydrolase [Verrucomicrobiota bacterium]